MLREIKKEKNRNIHVTKSERREVEHELWKGNFVIRRLSGERIVSSPTFVIRFDYVLNIYTYIFFLYFANYHFFYIKTNQGLF